LDATSSRQSRRSGFGQDHRGFQAHHWLLDEVRPPIRIHGHTTPASVAELVVRHAGTTINNAMGPILIEVRPGVGQGHPTGDA
jgi:hypothetical protein